MSRTILYLDHAPIWGGAEKVLVDLVRHLNRDRFRPIVARPAGSPLVDPLNQYSIQTVDMEFLPLNRVGIALPTNLVQAVGRVAALARRERVALLHSNTVRTHIPAALAGALMRIPVIWTLHDDTFPAALFRLLAPLTSRIVTVSGWLRDFYSTPRISERFRVIVNGLPPGVAPARGERIRSELGIEADTPLIVGVGRLIESKGHHHLLQAARAVQGAMPDVHFALIGGSDPGEAASERYRERLREAIGENGLGSFFHLLGHRSDVMDFYTAADLFVYTALQPEGLPTVLLEAMEAERAVVSTAIGGALEIVEPGKTGLLVPPARADELARAILALLADRERRQRMGEAGRRRRMEMFSIEAMVGNYENLYKTI